MRPQVIVLTIVAALSSGCFNTGPRKPLFGGKVDNPPARLGSPTTQTPPRQPHKATPAEKLLARLRSAGVGEGQRQVVGELLRRGTKARPFVRAAIEEERLLLDILEGVYRRLRPGARKKKKPKGRSVRARWVEAKYHLALDRYVAGDLYGALRLIDAILALEPDTHFAARLRRLRRRSQDRLVRESLLSADLVPSAKALLSKQRLTVRVRLKNVSRELIVLRMGERRAGLGVVSVDYEELSHNGTRTRVRTQVSVPHGQQALKIRPGQTRDLTLKLPAPHRRLPAGVVGRYHLGGWLRAHTMLVGPNAYPGFVPLLPVTLVVVSPRDRGLLANPRRSFSKAVKDASQGTLAQRQEPARRAFVASVLLASTDREAALRALATALREASGPLSEALCAGLARANREPLNFSRREWLMWWAGRSARPIREDK